MLGNLKFELFKSWQRHDWGQGESGAVFQFQTGKLRQGAESLRQHVTIQQVMNLDHSQRPAQKGEE